MIYIADLMVDKSFVAKYIVDIPDDMILVKIDEFEKEFCRKYKYKKAKLLMILPL